MSIVCEFCVCCQVEVSVADRSLVQRGPTDCGVSERDSEASLIRGPWPTVELLRYEGVEYLYENITVLPQSA
jgi:hypothetical protein